jgi:hypothetical protein
MGRHFISYSRVDAQDFVLRLAAVLTAGSPPVRVWLDQRELQPGRDWDEQIGEAIKTCDTLLFVMTRDGVKPGSVCKREWTLALKCKKPVIPLRVQSDAELPFRLEPREYIDFTSGFESGVERLRKHLLWLAEPEGVLQALKDRLADALRALSRSPEASRPRALAEIVRLERSIQQQQEIVENPHATAPVSAFHFQELLKAAGEPRSRGRADPSGRPDREGGTAAKQPTTWEPAVLERARQDLAAYIGPMAKVIVGRAAERARSVDELYQLLAAEIGPAGEREKFLASCPR